MFIDNHDLPYSLARIAKTTFSTNSYQVQEDAAFAFLSQMNPAQFPMFSTMHRLFDKDLLAFECNGFFVFFFNLLPGSHHILAINNPALACVTQGSGSLCINGDNNTLWAASIFHLPTGNHTLTTNEGCHIVLVSTCDKITNHDGY